MTISHRRLWLQDIVVVIILAAAFCGVAPASAQNEVTPLEKALNVHPVAGPNRPANVPEGYVITPFGYFHPSCVQTLAKGDSQLQDGRIHHANGATDENALTCGFPRYTKNGTPVVVGSSKAAALKVTGKSAPNQPVINDWVEDGAISTGSAKKSYGAILAEWTVPAQPTNPSDGQLLYFFPGFEDGYNTLSILQPVLRWYQGAWAIASWNCCINGVATNSDYVGVTSGDEIYGSVTSNCPAGTLSCPEWNVLTLDMSTGQSTTLGNTPSEEQAFGLAIGGTLEAYGVTSCDDYPSDGQISFEKIVVFDQDLKPVAKPKWVDDIFESIYPYSPNTTPQCGYALQSTKSKVTLVY